MKRVMNEGQICKQQYMYIHLLVNCDNWLDEMVSESFI